MTHRLKPAATNFRILQKSVCRMDIQRSAKPAVNAEWRKVIPCAVFKQPQLAISVLYCSRCFDTFSAKSPYFN